MGVALNATEEATRDASSLAVMGDTGVLVVLT